MTVSYNYRWKRLRLLHLQRHPLCVMCAQQGKVVPAVVVDHVKPHGGDAVLFWDENNWQSLCKPHHDASKQSEERRGFSLEVDATGWPADRNHPANRK
jgi:5-methylcytosine-specific restriction protein A